MEAHEKTDILNLLNNTAAEYPKSKALHHLIAGQAATTPDKTAIVFEDRSLSFKNVNEAANKLARHLLTYNIKTGDIIGLALDRSPEMVISLLAILKTGAAYVPLDPEYPKDRVEFMMEDSAAKVLLTSEKFKGHFISVAQEVLIEDALNKFDDYSADDPETVVGGNDLAYVLFTSGSTGKPKGVQIKHHNLVNFLLSMAKQPGLTPADNLLAVTTISFDIAGLELFLPLLVGAKLIVTDAITAKDGRALLDLCVAQQISVMQATPYTWRVMLEAGWEQKLPLKILCGGEALPKDLINKLNARSLELWNMYGPTETTVWSTVKLILNDTDITIGKPIDNTQVYILDEKLNNYTDGTIGEIYIGGDGVAKGYLNRPELTAERFVDDIFSNVEGSKMYRTGDLGKIREDGEIICLGRIDHQVKVRGYRIELEEIEQNLLKQNNVKQAVVIAREDIPGNPRLVAYIIVNEPIAEPDLKAQFEAWQQGLLAVLPEYMVPDDFVLMDVIPITPNGKIDRKALPKPDYSNIQRTGEFIAPRTANEKLVAEIWQEMMEIKSISIADNFFELGGRSLVAVKIMARIEKETSKRLPLATLFEHATIEKLAARLDIDPASITWESLVHIKPGGSKMPLYIVHGAGLNVLLFNALAMNMDADQPVYGLQAKGLNGIDEPLDVMEEIAANYIAEIVAQNPDGPYALAGYSLGGIIAYEMANQMIAAGRDVKMLAMFDTYADISTVNDPKLKKIVNKALLTLKQIGHTFVLLAEDPKRTIEYKSLILKRKLIKFSWKLFPGKDEKKEGFFAYDNEIDEASEKALRNYVLKPVNIAIELFRAKKRTFYMADFKFLGWTPFAMKGVNVHEIPGEHNSIFAPPNDKEFAVVLQECLDKASKN
ncbi:non-ribosomal peptide synthetase [Mucilaginibacter ginsenosidivorax]|uniref:Amino acid adenylation domain-containing protein n=1 Tax=Mucilaginibacter ginsenosidivorax TaxID=862126 RepID=A0A5B8VTA5_9SPHI|nr:amino acid adenylation domain-containing protein [Mucilaginibacter ginsenosidivorax]QEC74513.1 amino acid adenylation domain-containing protein [Mucilaginibacter ginsenosidivorax]